MADDPAAPRRRHARTRGRRLAMAVWAGVATAAVLLLIDALWAGRSLVRNLTRARSELVVGIEAIVTGDPEGARPHFVAAADAADRAIAAVGHPSLGIARRLPVAGANLDVAAGVAEASRSTALAGSAMVEVARTLDWSDIGLPASTAAGSLDVAAIEAAGPRMDGVVTRLEDALKALEATGGGRLVGPVAAGYRDAVAHLSRRADLAARLRDSLRLLPTMFGGDGPRRYLISIPSLGVPRPGGGVPMAVGILSANDGSLELQPFASDLEGVTPAPRQLASVPASPDWPTTARRLLEAAEAAGSPRLDGAITLDAVALEDLVWIAGDVPVEDRDLALSEATTSAALEIDAFLGRAGFKTARTHAAWASEILAAFLDRRPGLESFALATARDTHERHLSIYLVRRPEQRLVRALGVAGDAPAPEAGILPLLATWSATEPSHVGALVETLIRHEVTLGSDGSARVRTEVSFDNGAGTDPPSVLLGRGSGGVPIGTFSADVTVYLPAEARDVEAETSRPSPIAVDEELGFATVTGSVSIRPGTSATLTTTYVVRDAVVPERGTNRLVLRLAPQPTIDGIVYEVRIAVPEGADISAVSPGLERRVSAATFSGTRAGPLDLELRYVG